MKPICVYGVVIDETNEATMWDEALLDAVIRRAITQGCLDVAYPSGRIASYGDGPVQAAVDLRNNRTVRGLLMNPTYEFGAAFVRGDIQVAKGDIYDVVSVLFSNINGLQRSLTVRLSNRLRSLHQPFRHKNNIGRARDNIEKHYDIDEQIYRLFLDQDMQYSCGYFNKSSVSLQDAQKAKKQRVINKLNLPPEGRVLDIGCGWGGLALDIARAHTDLEVVGITLSPKQYKIAKKRATEAGLSHRVHFQLQDYREIKGPFDRIVSVGMFEHVDLKDYRSFFTCLRNLLSHDGVALLHTIGRLNGPGTTNPWIRQHIFPGGRLPSLSEIVPVVEEASLLTSDIEVLRLHYALTLREWRRRFADTRAEVAQWVDDEFCRAWELYLAGSEASFRHLGHAVFQIQLLKSIDAAPMTRAYMEGSQYTVGYGADVAA